jgi:hypothetical protein
MTKALTIPSAGGARSKFGPRKAPLRVQKAAVRHDQFRDPMVHPCINARPTTAMEAFDLLPPLTQAALREAVHDFSALAVYASWVSGAPNCRTDAMMAHAIRELDNELMKREVR